MTDSKRLFQIPKGTQITRAVLTTAGWFNLDIIQTTRIWKFFDTRVVERVAGQWLINIDNHDAFWVADDIPSRLIRATWNIDIETEMAWLRKHYKI